MIVRFTTFVAFICILALSDAFISNRGGRQAAIRKSFLSVQKNEDFSLQDDDEANVIARRSFLLSSVGATLIGTSLPTVSDAAETKVRHPSDDNRNVR